MNYDACAIPKPKDKKKKILYNGYKDKANRHCFYCKTPYAERHEVFQGVNRQISIREKFQVDLCHACHEEIQNKTTERGQKRDRQWKMYFQKKWELELRKSGISKEQAREAWIQMIGRSYI